jgi:hypothetical protein
MRSSNFSSGTRRCFVDRADDDSIFPIIHPERDQSLVYEAFNKFYAANVMCEHVEAVDGDCRPFSI